MELFDQPQNNQCVTIIVFRALIKLHPIADVKTRRFFLDGTHRSPPTSTVCSRSPSGCALTSPCRMPAQGGRKRFANSSLGRDRGSCCLVYPDRSVDARLRCAKGSTFPEICFELSFSARFHYGRFRETTEANLRPLARSGCSMVWRLIFRL